MDNKLPRVYDPHQVEDRWYAYWMDRGFFRAEGKADNEPFTIVIPPPNVTGSLHIGHALNNTLQDLVIRWRRMQGYNTLWLPGTDHAGIATQARVERNLAEEGISRHELGREKFLERVWAWREEYGGKILNQLKKLGSSCDWSRERFTLDEGCSQAVREVFVRLYEQGLIYQGDHIINWCPRCSTALSDIEVEHEEEQGHLWHICYPFADREGSIEVATTRPETMLGDTAVAVSPDDQRYRDVVGQEVVLPLIGRRLPIIADDYVDSDFGSGMVKVTPAHDPNDFEIGKRHDLEEVKVIGFDGNMTEKAGDYADLDRYECRKRVLNDLRKQGLLAGEEEHEHAVGHCSRCDTVVEPLISKQWFVKMEPLAQPAIEAAENGDVEFIPNRFKKVYMNWLENIRDWCISRQLWWGHRIPVWYCDECDAVLVEREDPEQCGECGNGNLRRDPDVLDTWFSSALWPFSTLGWPENTRDLEIFYPTSLLITGYDIIFFWVARMIFMGLEFMDEVPFPQVYLTGLVRDEDGKKMSKSLGNVVDPLEFIEDYGADTLRFTLISINTAGNDMRFRQEQVESSRNFANKIWNAARFLIMNLEDFDPDALASDELDYTLADRWILSRYNRTVRRVTRFLEDFRYADAAQALYDFIWGEYCDWYIELIKPRLYDSEDDRERKTAQYVAWKVLKDTVKLLHPFMPFITEEIYQHLPHEGESIMVAPWPKPSSRWASETCEDRMGQIMEIIRAVRNIKSELDLRPQNEVPVIIRSGGNGELGHLDRGREYIRDLAGVETVEIDTPEKPEKALTAIVDDLEIYVPLEGVVDIDKEIVRLEEELETVESEIARAEGKLANEGFVNNAPPELVEEEREKVCEYRKKKDKLKERLAMLAS